MDLLEKCRNHRIFTFDLSSFLIVLLSRLSEMSETTRRQLEDEKGVCHMSIGVRIDTFAECETEVAFGATY